MRVRQTISDDIVGLQRILDATELFPSEMLPEMIDGFLNTAEPDDLWLTCESGSGPIGFSYARPEPLTESTWNMLAIAVDPNAQGKGAGAALTAMTETELANRGARLLIVDTSGTAEFAATRMFYKKNGYTEEARIKDYWSVGDDKVIFTKTL